MDSTVLLSYRKRTPSSGPFPESSSVSEQGVTAADMECHRTGKQSQSGTSVPLATGKMTCHPKKGTFNVSEDKFASRQIQLSSSLSTTYASSSSSSAASTTSEEELPSTARRYSDSNQSRSSSSQMSSHEGDSGFTSAQEACANSNAGFVVDEDDLCNNNALIDDATLQLEKINLDEETEEEEEDPASMIELKPTVKEVANKSSSKKKKTKSLLKNCFISLYVNGRRCSLTINAKSLTYEPELSSNSKQNERVVIPLEQILSVWTCHCDGRSTSPNRSCKPTHCPCLVSDPARKSPSIREVDPSSVGPSFLVKVFYAAKSSSEGLKLEMLALSAHNSNSKAGVDSRAASEHLLADMAYKIKDSLEAFDRPKRLLFFVNPYGGSKKATKVFDREVKPLLELGRADYTVVVTERANEARDILLNEETNLDQFDGIICVGGDGMFGEILNGVLIRTQQEYQVDFGSPECLPIKPKITLGIIPAGSTDAVVYATSGYKTPLNSVLGILLGRKLNIDITAVHQRDEDTLLQYTASFLGYGFFGDILADSERNRWLGPRRYDWAGFKKFFKLRLYSGEIKLIIEPSDGSPKQFNPCGVGCSTCQKAGGKSKQTLNPDDSPACISIRGRFLAINAATVSGRCAKSKLGLSPMAHVGNGCTDLILVSKCSRWDYLRYMFRLSSGKSTFDYNFVDTYRVREFEFNPIIEPHKRKSYFYEKEADCDFFDAFSETDGDSSPSEGKSTMVRSTATATSKKRRPGGCSLSPSVWNCDGEIISEPAIHVKVHCQLVSLFATGVEVEALFENQKRPVTVCFQ